MSRGRDTIGRAFSGPGDRPPEETPPGGFGLDDLEDEQRVTVSYMKRSGLDSRQEVTGRLVDDDRSRDDWRKRRSVTIKTDDGERFRVTAGGEVHRFDDGTISSAGYFAEIRAANGGGDDA